MKLVLFDIDGTLLRSDGAGRRAMEGALTHVFGSPGDPGYRYDGKTDLQIARELMRLEGHDDEAIDAGREAVLAWLTGPASASTTTSTRLSSERSGRTSVVRSLLEGDFPGGRVELRYAFVEDPDGLITALTITA